MGFPPFTGHLGLYRNGASSPFFLLEISDYYPSLFIKMTFELKNLENGCVRSKISSVMTLILPLVKIKSVLFYNAIY